MSRGAASDICALVHEQKSSHAMRRFISFIARRSSDVVERCESGGIGAGIRTETCLYGLLKRSVLLVGGALLEHGLEGARDESPGGARHGRGEIPWTDEETTRGVSFRI